MGLAGIFLAGCYTQFALIDRSPEPQAEHTETYIDSSGDTVTVVRQVDTVEVEKRQVCYWQRDWFGRPVLRCYRTYYDDDWYYYNDYPWWYSDYSRYSHYNCHCPYHTHYNPHCRYCWDYCNMYCYDCYDESPATHRSSGSYSSPPPSSRRAAPSGSRGGSSGGVIVKKREKKPFIAGPRPEPSSSSESLPKGTVDPKAPAAQSGGSSSSDYRESRPPPDTTTAGKPDQPRRRYGRTR